MNIARGLIFLPMLLAGCLAATDPVADVSTPLEPQVDVQPIPDEERRFTVKITGIAGQSFANLVPIWDRTLDETCSNTTYNPFNLNEILERDALGRTIPTLQGTVSCRPAD
ncbi:hypothetical protein LGT41_0014215 [Abyssibius alkaniclasticus]|uniref:hypothetical protein n=1 Tax=Abyssibius alkaniclasticus TaxID=2881234 RepID=UPI002363B0BD|nr:hypothetical protein [Abyssibius alkaniclasticus]UPH70923.1 hypothetical protein LGT41_0014215 [Abyssibius alkaniclasticus]